MINYRFANEEDIGQLLEMARTFHDVSGLSNYGAEFNPSHVREMLYSMIVNQDSLVLVAADFDERMVYGAIGAHLSHHVMNRNQGLVMELFQWVRPEARGHGIGSTLLEHLEYWGKGKGAVTVTMMSMCAIDSPAGVLFSQKGYTATETVWMKRL